MKSKLLFHRQETLYSCVPACLRIVLSGFGYKIAEAELRDLCDCTFFGTEALKAVDAVRKLGFSNTIKCTLSLNELAICFSIAKPPVFRGAIGFGYLSS